MALDELELSLMAFPQRWDGAGGKLTMNTLLLPVGDPTAPLGSGPAFAGTAVHLLVNIVAGLDSLPSTTATPNLTVPVLAQPPVVAPTLFTTLYNQLVAKGITVKSAKLTNAPPLSARIKKSLPPSYTQAFPFETPRTLDLGAGPGYCCALRDQAPTQANPNLPPPDNSISWGQVLSYALRQPALAQALGLVYPLTIDVPAGLLDGGGWLYVTLDAGIADNPWLGDWQTHPDTVKSYAARIPQLTGATRPLFAATLIPVVAIPPSNLAQAQLEAEEYDDGFAQVVHSNQPATIDAATLEPNQIAPGVEAGLQIGWDDEQVTVWLNNQIDLLRDRVNGTTNAAEAPLGVQGYRVDVRRKGTAAWRSLSMVNGSLPFDDNSYGGGASLSIDGTEFWTSPAPVRPSADDNSTNSAEAWLPLYFAQWAGSSLVLPDPAQQLLAYAAQAYQTPAMGNPLPVLPTNPAADLSAVPVLLYGDDYEFRVRFADLTGGGPLVTDDIVHEGQAPIALGKFRRYLPPKSLEVEASPAIAPPPANPPAVRVINTLSVKRPRIGYPEAVFAGVDPSTFSAANLADLIQDAWANGGVLDVPDPDVDSFDIRVEAKIPAHDTGTIGVDPGNLDANFRIVYSVNVPFPTDPADDSTVTISLNYTDGIDDISTLTPPMAGSTEIPIPAGRDIRVRLYPRCAARPNYYGTDEPPAGLSSDYIVRKEAGSEDGLIPNNPELQLRALYFQPGANVAQLLAQELGLHQSALTFSSAPGVRTAFGASGALRHSVSADGGSLTFSNATELTGQWILALVLGVERDWTWDGFGSPALQFARGVDSIGVVNVPRVVPPEAAGTPGHPPDRSYTQVVFFDAISGAPAKFPAELTPQYTVTANFAVAPPQQFHFDIRLPITTPPVQTPKIVSTGIAESPYVRADDYSATAPRDRYLWVEFDAPLADEEDAYFGRVLAYGPDPLLAAGLLPKGSSTAMLSESTEPPLPIDPEPVRVIFSGQAADSSGLDSMTQLSAAKLTGVGAGGTFFLLPLPPGISSEDLELFGFWTYEFRVGHAKLWSTAQGRYGRPLRVSGVQHPSPHLTCSIGRDTKGIYATAPYANTVYNGTRVYDLLKGDPQTTIWFMLYAQVLQADGATNRNVLLTHLPGTTVPNPQTPHFNPQHSFNRDPRAAASFPANEIAQLLAALGLPGTSGLSVLAVELLPGPLTLRFERGGQPAVEAVQEDPLGSQLGLRRILRTSPLAAVPSSC